MQESARRTPEALVIPFDVPKLDRLMEEAGIDVLLATSKHNVQYLLGAERAIFFDYMDALGVSRYLPITVYPKQPLNAKRLFRSTAFRAERRCWRRSGAFAHRR